MTSTPPRRRRRRPAGAPAAPSSASAAALAALDAPAEAGPASAAAPTAADDLTFAALGVPAPLVRALEGRGMAAPFAIQAATLPDTLAGRDVLGRGRTGSGKTLAFAIPLVAGLLGGRSEAKRPRGLVLVPTRELANQVLDTIEPLARAGGLRATAIFGGVGQAPQARALAQGVDIVVACPGRLEDLISQRLCDLSGVAITVLDEADHMADLGFLPGVKRILDRTPPKGQRLLFSATLDNGVGVLVERYLHQPVTHSVDPAVAPVSTMAHHVFSVSAADKAGVVRELASGQERSLLFMRTKHTAKRLAKQLTAAGIPAVELHGNLSQGARERNLAAFATGERKVMVATDIAARGIHVDHVALVVHVDPPTEHKAYLHRSGRTARAGAGGAVVTLATPDQRGEVATLARKAGIRPTTVTVVPGHDAISELVGPPAPLVDPALLVPASPSPVGGGGGGRRGGTSRRGGAGSGRTAAAGRGADAGGGGGRAAGSGRGTGGAGRGAGPVAGGAGAASARAGGGAAAPGRRTRAGQGAAGAGARSGGRGRSGGGSARGAGGGGRSGHAHGGASAARGAR